jgi:hypothetical protein
LEITYEEIYNISSIGQKNTFSGDFDQDGTIEIAFSTGNSVKSYLKFLKAEGDGYKEIKSIVPASSEIKWIEYNVTDNLIYIAESRRILSYDPLTDEVIVIYDGFEDGTINGSIQKFLYFETEFKNIFLIQTSSQLILIDQDGHFRFKENFGSINDIAIGNVDEEINNEIVISLNEGSKILDLFTFEVEWEYFSTFGNFIAVGDYDGDGVSLVYGVNYEGILCFDIQLESPIWMKDADVQSRRFEFVPADIENDAVLIFAASGDAISVRNPITGNQVWEVSSPDSYNSGMILKDLDEDGERDLFYASGGQLVVRDLDASMDWLSEVRKDRAFIDIIDRNDGDVIDYISCSGSSNSFDGGLLKVHNGETNSVILGPVFFDNFSDIDELASIHYEGDTYYLAKERYGEIFLYKNTFASLFASLFASFDDWDVDLDDIQLIQLEEGGDPHIAGLNNNSQFSLYSFVRGNISLGVYFIIILQSL